MLLLKIERPEAQHNSQGAELPQTSEPSPRPLQRLTSPQPRKAWTCAPHPWQLPQSLPKNAHPPSCHSPLRQRRNASGLRDVLTAGRGRSAAADYSAKTPPGVCYQSAFIRTHSVAVSHKRCSMASPLRDGIPKPSFSAYRMISYHIISCHVVSYHTIPYYIISYHIVSYHIISNHIILCVISYITS